MNFYSLSFFGFVAAAAGLGLILILHNASLVESNSRNMSNNGEGSGGPSLRAADRIRNEPESVWVEFIQLALEHKPLNLGQGFPDFAAPAYLIESLHNATEDFRDSRKYVNNQYTRSFGHPRLIKALQAYYNQFRDFRKLVDPQEQVLVTVGAYEALFTAIMAFVNPGDEVIIIDPAFDAYQPMVEMAQGKAVFVPLRLIDDDESNKSEKFSSAQFELNMTEFKSKISNKTRALILNTPNNPLGKIYSRTELRAIANLCKQHNLLVIADEVYEQMFYQPEGPGDSNALNHLSIATMPGMWERTITIGSAGKTFSVTGWKIGWALGPSNLIRYLQLVHQTAVYTVATPLQEAIAAALEKEMSLTSGNKTNYWDQLRLELQEKRNRMGRILMRANMRPIVPQGGYFMLADFSPLARHFNQEYQREGEVQGKPNTNDYKFVRWLSARKKLQGIPASAFYSTQNKPLAANLVRFCFIKENSTLDKLEALIGQLAANSDSESDSGSDSQPGAGPKAAASPTAGPPTTAQRSKL